uniref:U6 snRNA-associated Sm-like protein LSm6 n=1 Tax=Amphiprion ocellaris TaxID=80972 RepID=A0A3Q1AGX0_AMPOC
MSCSQTTTYLQCLRLCLTNVVSVVCAVVSSHILHRCAFFGVCPYAGSVECSPLIGQFAVHAKHDRLENVRLITVKMSLRKQTPSDFLKQIIGRPVVVKLNSGVDYRGVLACLDGYMNIAIEQTEEYVNGQLKNKYGDAFLRGNNVRNCINSIIHSVQNRQVTEKSNLL